MNIMFYFSMVLTIISNVFYHICQKSISSKVNPLFSLLITYLIAVIGCLILLPFYPEKTKIIDNLKEINWASIILGFAIVGLEMGFLLVYRSGWNINIAVIVCNTIVTMILIPIGILIFKEKISLINILGIFLCIIGLILINKK
ncbi:MAG TPA: EamA family transporter [Spirochaetota bacterium]|nr:EamA family transporter [Spirochaetota bacterium]